MPKHQPLLHDHGLADIQRPQRPDHGDAARDIAFSLFVGLEAAQGTRRRQQIAEHVLRRHHMKAFAFQLRRDRLQQPVVAERAGADAGEEFGAPPVRLQFGKAGAAHAAGQHDITRTGGAQSVEHGAGRPQPDPEIDVAADAVRLRMPFEPEHEGLAADRPAGVQQPDRQITAARDDAELRKHSPRGAGRSDATLPRG